MHRTQILLEDWQYEALKARAQREGRSLSDLLREIVTSQIGRRRRPATSRLAQIEGLGSDPKASGREHDRFLYGEKRRA